MTRHEHFCLIGLKPFDRTGFQESGEFAVIRSDDGTADKGGTLVALDGNPDGILYSLGILTRILLCTSVGELQSGFDEWRYRHHVGRTLRELLERTDERI